MKEWITAGVRGGIPYVDRLDIKKTLDPGVDNTVISAAMAEVAQNGGGAILLKNGTYHINQQIDLVSHVSLVGESREGVICQIDKNIQVNNQGRNKNRPGARDDGNAAFKFGEGVSYSGLYRLTLKGGWGIPKQKWNVGSRSKNNELPGNENISIWIMQATDCWVDDVTILNSADFPVRCLGSHITLRGLYVDGCFNKCGGCHGYFMLLGNANHNLITDCFVTHLRHISLQDEGVMYNVLYDNHFEQEISFHTHDGGNNLIEYNRITLPTDMPNASPSYHAIMGPWSTQHRISKCDNYLYRNHCVELNHNGDSYWSDNSKIYKGPTQIKIRDPFPASHQIPSGGTLYPIMLNNPNDRHAQSPQP